METLVHDTVKVEKGGNYSAASGSIIPFFKYFTKYQNPVLD